MLDHTDISVRTLQRQPGGGGCSHVPEVPGDDLDPVRRLHRAREGADALRRNQRRRDRSQRRADAGRDDHADQPGHQRRARAPDQRVGAVRDAGDPAWHLHAEGHAQRVPHPGAAGHHRAGRQRRAASRHAGSRPAHRGRRDHGRRAAAADLELGGRHGHREPRDRRAAAQRTQLPAARLAHPRRHDQRSLVEPGQAAHGRAAQQLRAERRRPAHPLQPLLARRDREHRPELQLLHAAAVGGRAAGVQRRRRPVRRGVRPRDRADQRLDEVGHQPAPRHGLRVRAPFVARREELLRSRRSADPAVQAQPVRRDDRRPGRHSQAGGRPRPAVLPVQLGRAARDQVADGDAVGAAHRLADRRLLGPARRQRQPDSHLRSGDARLRCRRQRAPGADAVPRQPDPGQPHPSRVAAAARVLAAAARRNRPAPTT